MFKRLLVLPALLLPAFASATPATSALKAYPAAYNLLASPLSAYPVLTANDAACARAVAFDGIQQPLVGQIHTPQSLGVVCGVSTSNLFNDAYLSAMFIAYVDSHRHVFQDYCPAPYDAQGSYDPSVKPGHICAF